MPPLAGGSSVSGSLSSGSGLGLSVMVLLLPWLTRETINGTQVVAMDYTPIIAAAFVASVTAFLIWRLRAPADRYCIRPRLKDEWGTRFDIVDLRTGSVVGFDWYTLARQRCRELNEQAQAGPGRPTTK